MNNLTLSGSSDKKTSAKQEETKTKKKIDYTKEIADLQKMYTRIKEKYDLSPHSKVSNTLIDISAAIDNLKKFEY
jgi:hypothetical protein